MDNMVDVLRIAAAGIGGIATYIWGPWDALIIALVAMGYRLYHGHNQGSSVR